MSEEKITDGTFRKEIKNGRFFKVIFEQNFNPKTQENLLGKIRVDNAETDSFLVIKVMRRTKGKKLDIEIITTKEKLEIDEVMPANMKNWATIKLSTKI